MNRMRALMIKSSRRLSRPVVAAADWWRAIGTTPAIALDTVRRRLELLLAGMYGTRFEIVPTKSDAARHALHAATSSEARYDGITIELPSAMDATDGAEAAIARYRLLAIEQAARIVRGSSALAPGDDEPVARDLYNLRESAEIDASISKASPGVTALLADERSRALAERGSSGKLSERERAVEDLVKSVLRSAPAELPSVMRAGSSPEESLAWARATAAGLAEFGGTYRARPPVSVWGQTLGNGTNGPEVRSSPIIPPTLGYGSGSTTAPAPGTDDTLQELSPEGVNAPRSAGVPDERDAEKEEPSPDDAAMAVRAPATSDGRAAAPARGVGSLNNLDTQILAASRSSAGILYREWDCNASEYRDLGAVVRQYPPIDGDSAWSDRVLGEHPALVRGVRREFERLRARRVRMLRQRDGDELDLAACVRAVTDATARDSSDDRLYMAVRSARRAIAITVLVDVSGSTNDTIGDGRRAIDVEKTTLLLASEAFDALGDAYSILTFSSGGAADVRVSSLKGFAEPNGDAIRRRIAGIEAGGNTRLGAAVRHATATLTAQPAGHRLLLILSDGKPNDVDRYFTTYAIEDSRQAVLEARAAGVYPFCLTIDANDPEPYLARVFGLAGHTILRRPEQLPLALLELVRQLLGGGGVQ